jgi:hypothetical protein
MLGSTTHIISGAAVTSYQPMTLADLGRRLARLDDTRTRWKLVWEFLEEYRWEPDDVQPSLLQDEPPATGDERWDALLAALAEHLAAQHDLAAPGWTEIRVLQRPWFPAESSGPMRWSGRRQRSASTAFTCPPGTWRLRDRAG